jgi:hypothetical protein
MFSKCTALAVAVLVAGSLGTAPARAAQPAKPVSKPAARPTPAPIQEEEPDMQLGAQFSLGAQLTSGDGLLGNLKVLGTAGIAELGASLMMPPSSPLSFFTVDAYLAFVGHTRSFLPIDLMPVMGFGMASSFRDVTTAKGPTTDLNMWMYMPVGLRYQLRLGGLSVGAEALYHFPALYLMKGITDPARWHFELNSRVGGLVAGAFYEMGPVYNGPGARVGLAF